MLLLHFSAATRLVVGQGYHLSICPNFRGRLCVLGEHRFVSRYELKSYVWLMLGNLLGMVLTLGLFYPWAKVRTARYAADHIAVQVTGSLDGFVAAQQDGVTATGGEMADLFDIEIGL
ncbi:MAG: DUF898 family protein [Azonexus sp.]